MSNDSQEDKYRKDCQEECKRRLNNIFFQVDKLFILKINMARKIPNDFENMTMREGIREMHKETFYQVKSALKKFTLQRIEHDLKYYLEKKNES